MRFAAVLAATALWLVAAIPVSAADTLTPSPVTVSLTAGASTTVNKTLTLDGLPATADIIVAIDTTASMGIPIAQAQADANNLCSYVQGLIPGARFAVVALGDYPAMPAGAPTDVPYLLLTPGFISSCAAFSAAIGTMTAHDGGDFPEAYNRTFFEAYSDAAYAAPVTIAAYAAVLRAPSNGQAFDCSASSRNDAAVSVTDIMISGRGCLPYHCS